MQLIDTNLPANTFELGLHAMGHDATAKFADKQERFSSCSIDIKHDSFMIILC